MLHRFEAPISLSDQPLPFGAHGSSNWVWLARIARFERAVDVGGSAAHTAGLERHFETVVRVDSLPASGSLPVADASADCIALRVMVDADGVTEPRALLRDCRRVLRAGGCLSFGFENGRWLSRARARRGAGRVAAGLSVPAVRQLVEGAGFSALDVYYADPAFAAPTALIEPTAEAARAFEAEKPMRSGLALARPLLARAGLHGMLYPAYFGIAYA